MRQMILYNIRVTFVGPNVEIFMYNYYDDDDDDDLGIIYPFNNNMSLYDNNPI